MIVPLTPHASARFPATALPENCQGPALQHQMIPRVASWSMYPTLCKGDRLELEPAEPLHVGDLIVYRKAFGLVCHRLVARHDARLLTQGDACSGPPEQVLPQDVLGRVVAVTRGSSRLDVRYLSGLAPPSPWRRSFDLYALTLRRTSRVIAGRLIRPVLRHPWSGEFIARLLARYATIDRIAASPIRSLDATAETGRWKLPLDGTERHMLPQQIVFRVGPIYLGTYDLRSEILDIRPILTGTRVQSALAQAMEHKRDRQ